MADLEPTVYTMPPMMRPQRQKFMTGFAPLNIAALHSGMGYGGAAKACAGQTLRHLISLKSP